MVLPSMAIMRPAEAVVKAAIIIACGFSETGPAGEQREHRLKEICAKHSIALIGPNCLGVINTHPGVCLNASFARKMPATGRIAFLSQSGALCTAVLDYARDKAIGFSKCVSFGNRADVTEIELIEYLHDDDQTDVILLYLEAIHDGRALIETARRLTTGPKAKPILAIKSGRTTEGSRAAASHTGSLAGEDAVCDAVFQQAGIVRVNDIEELLNPAIMLVHQPMPRGNRLAIVTNAGGAGVMAVDAAVHDGLEIAQLSPATTARLRRILPATASIKNPVDIIGDARADRYRGALQAVLADPGVDEVLVILTPQSMTDAEAIAQAVVRVSRETDKPTACSFMGTTEVAAGVRILQSACVPQYSLPEWACHAMADVQQIRMWRQTPQSPLRPVSVDRAAVAAVLDAAPNGYLREDQGLAVLKAYGLCVPPYQLCTSPQAAGRFAEQIGFPVVVRLVSPHVVHKTEVGGVVLNVPDAESVEQAYEGVLTHLARVQPGAAVHGVIVRRMIPSGREVILGAKRDPTFGPTLMFGLGGLYVEIFQDVTFALAPISVDMAAHMVRQVKPFRLLEGIRGEPRADIEGIQMCLVALGQLVTDFPRIAELDVNPLIVGPESQGCAVADVRIYLNGTP
jgi:acetyltransferase